MKFAAIADVHGNHYALEAVLADIARLGIKEVVNLGDHVSARSKGMLAWASAIATGWVERRVR